MLELKEFNAICTFYLVNIGLKYGIKQFKIDLKFLFVQKNVFILNIVVDN